MLYRLHAANLRTAAGTKGDRSDYSIAKRSNLTRGTISRLVNGQVEPRIGTLDRLAECYGITIESLICKVEPEVVLSA